MPRDTLPDPDERPSKTVLKKQAHELQGLGEALVELPDERLAALPISEALLIAVREHKRTRSHEGRRRQMQYIGKLMRKAETGPLREAVASAQLGGARSTLELHRAERWRVELVDNDDALTRWTAAHPQSDLQQLRSLVRAARKDAALPPEQRHGRAWRDLFQFIKPHMATVENADE
jgi:ribosome-associated protein